MGQSLFANLFDDANSCLEEVHYVDVYFKYNGDDPAEPWKIWAVKPERDGAYSDPIRRRSDADNSRQTCDFIIPHNRLECDTDGRRKWPDRASVIRWEGNEFHASAGGLDSHPYVQGEGHEAQTIRFFTVDHGPYEE